ncbi:hypothetical protein OUZ56_007297 [Daphnia magna]|uniref:Uncharacterized protein n=1 Tax=Daphnia magna TaxID=35525 RepID=A0ABQ9YY62_9CRUS|nr:hypothetical protein OUZ56_007297 [Daphnia magna]
MNVRLSHKNKKKKKKKQHQRALVTHAHPDEPVEIGLSLNSRDRSVRLFLLPLEVCAYGNLCRRQKDMLTMKEDDVNYLIQQLSVADLRIIVELYLY